MSVSYSNSRRNFIKNSIAGTASLLTTVGGGNAKENSGDIFSKQSSGAQRLSLEKLKVWEELQFGLFIHFGLSTFLEREVPFGYESPMAYAPDRLNVEQWVLLAKRAGARYAILTAKHASGHCLWPSVHTNYTVAHSANKTDVVLEFVEACYKHRIQPGLYYNCIDTHHRYGSKTLLELKPSSISNTYPKGSEVMAPFTSSMYQNFVTDQLQELLTNYGELSEIWIDNPGVLGKGYRTYLYHLFSGLQPDALIMMANAMGDGTTFDQEAAWPSDLIAIKDTIPPDGGHKKWRKIGGQSYYLPGEACMSLSNNWFYMPQDQPKPEKILTDLFTKTRGRGANFLLNVPPNKEGLIPNIFEEALLNLGRNINI